MDLSVFTVLKGIMTVFISFLIYMFMIGTLSKLTDEKAAFVGALFITIGATYVIFMWFIGLGILSVLLIAGIVYLLGPFIIGALTDKLLSN